MKQATVTVNTPAKSLLDDQFEAAVRDALKRKGMGDRASDITYSEDAEGATVLSIDGDPFFRFHPMDCDVSEGHIVLSINYEEL
jgi:hypothetical protein